MALARPSHPRPKAIVPLGDAAVLVEFGDVLDTHVNAFIQRLSFTLRERSEPWIRDIVPAIASLAIHVDIARLGDTAALAAVERLVETVLKGRLRAAAAVGRDLVVPICYEAAYAIDMEDICQRTKLTPELVARYHAASDFRVLMVGFAPGHPYLGGLDARLSVPRRASPRPRMPRGGVAIANAQCIVEPYEIPGGWSLIGRSPLRVFDATRTEPSLFAPADRVRFVAIDAATYDEIAHREGTAE